MLKIAQHALTATPQEKDMVEYGPIQLLALGFPDVDKLRGALLQEISKLSESGLIRVVGLQAIVKDAEGNIAAAEVTGLPEEERIKLGAVVGALIGLGAAGEEGATVGAQIGAETVAQKEFGLSQTEIEEIAADIPDGTAAVFLLIEHLWAKRFKEIARAQDGVVLAEGFVSPEALVTIGALLAEGAEVAEKLQAR